jgi:hypothetical protein
MAMGFDEVLFIDSEFHVMPVQLCAKAFKTFFLQCSGNVGNVGATKIELATECCKFLCANPGLRWAASRRFARFGQCPAVT